MGINPNPEFLSAEDEARAYRAIARVALYWGPIELQIEGFLIILRIRLKTDGPFPASFSRKIAEAKDHLKNDPELAAARDYLRPLMSRAKELHRLRTHVVHCYFQGQYIDGRLGFGRSDQKIGVAYREDRYSIKQLENACEKMIELHDKMAKCRIPLKGGHTMQFELR
jgi:hypothetical protein